MRIIAGLRRGQKLFGFEGQDIRPTTDRVRESLFDLIADHVPGADVLDLFGGSGALSLEALSRGANSAVICDISSASVDVIKRNVKITRFDEKVTVKKISASDMLKSIGGKYDIIFLDPPYNKGLIGETVGEIIRCGVLFEGGIIVLESDGTDEHGDFSGLTILKQRRYGRSFITIYQRGDK